MIVKQPKISEYYLRKKETGFPQIKVLSSRDLYKTFNKFYGDDLQIYETFYMLCFNTSMMTKQIVKISQGGIGGTIVDMRLIAFYAVRSLSTRVAFAHNHPGGALYPSKEDIKLTKQAKKGLEYLEITLIDHLILAQDGYYSFADEGIL